MRNYRPCDSSPRSESDRRRIPATINNVIYRDGKFSIAVLARSYGAKPDSFPRDALASPEEALAANKSSLMIRPLAQSQISHPPL